MRSFKIYADPEKNKINSDLILDLINELTLIHNSIIDNHLLSAGFQLGRLQGDLVILREQLEAKEKIKPPSSEIQ